MHSEKERKSLADAEDLSSLGSYQESLACAQLPEGCSLPGIQIPRLTRRLSIFCNCDCVNAESSAIVQVRVSFLGISLCSLTGDYP
jgi:hypothetical protein